MRTLTKLYRASARVAPALLLMAAGSATASANLLNDGSFEDPNNNWLFVAGGGNNTAIWNDDNDGLGFDRDFFGDFSGVNAEDGHHWAAAFAYPADHGAWGQLMGSTLDAGQSYTISGWLHRSVRSDIDSAGGWDVLINNSASLTGAEYLGHLGDTTTDTAWQQFTDTFVAPNDAASMPYFIFQATGTFTYTALDNVDLEPPSGTPEPCTTLLLVGCAATYLKRRKLNN
jgi:hypothetical protein